MFATTPNFEQWVPEAIAPGGETFWRAVSISLRTPWYLLTYRHREDDGEFVETTAVAWERTLLEMIEEIGVSDVVAVGCISPSSDGRPEWVMKQVRELLLPAEDEARITGPLLFALRGEEGLYDSHQSKLLSDGKKREVLVSFGPQ